VDKLPIDQVTKHFELIMEVEKQEEKNKTELIKEGTKFFNKLFKSYMSR
jgi:hypothetical protein